MVVELMSQRIEQTQKWNEAAIAFLKLRLEDDVFDVSLPDRVFLHPMSEYDPDKPPKCRGEKPDDLTDVYISIDDPRDFKIGASPVGPE